MPTLIATPDNSISALVIFSKPRRTILLAGFCAFQTALPGQRIQGPPDNDRLLKSVMAVLPGAQTVEPSAFRLTQGEKETLRKASGLTSTPDSLLLLVAAGSDTLMGFAVRDDVRGKDQLITYLLVVSPDLQVRGLEILAYRESFGGEVRNETWRDQFKGKSGADPLRPGRDISNITGATISARAVTLGVKRLLLLLEVLRPRLPKRRAALR